MKLKQITRSSSTRCRLEDTIRISKSGYMMVAKDVLRKIDNPEFIRVFVDTSAKMIGIQSAQPHEQDAFSVTVRNKAKSGQVYSKDITTTILKKRWSKAIATGFKMDGDILVGSYELF